MLESKDSDSPNLNFVAQIQTGNLVSSGILISKEHGIVLTNSHCVESDFLGASLISKITIIFKIGGEDQAFEAKVLAKANNLPHEDLESLDVCLL